MKFPTLSTFLFLALAVIHCNASWEWRYNPTCGCTKPKPRPRPGRNGEYYRTCSRQCDGQPPWKTNSVCACACRCVPCGTTGKTTLESDGTGLCIHPKKGKVCNVYRVFFLWGKHTCEFKCKHCDGGTKGVSACGNSKQSRPGRNGEFYEHCLHCSKNCRANGKPKSSNRTTQRSVRQPKSSNRTTRVIFSNPILTPFQQFIQQSVNQSEPSNQTNQRSDRKSEPSNRTDQRSYRKSEPSYRTDQRSDPATSGFHPQNVPTQYNGWGVFPEGSSEPEGSSRPHPALPLHALKAVVAMIESKQPLDPRGWIPVIPGDLSLKIMRSPGRRDTRPYAVCFGTGRHQTICTVKPIGS